MWAWWTPNGADVPPCLRCSKRPAVTIHENIPRSVKEEWGPDDWIYLHPVCAECHDIVQDDPSTRVDMNKRAVRRAHKVSEWKGDAERTLWEYDE